MESKFPKKVKTYKVGDKVICIDKKHEGWYMVRGVIKHVGPTPKSKDKNKIGVEFEKNILKKVKTVFKTKPGHGAYVESKNLMKYTRDFDVKAFKKYFEKKKKPKKKKAQEKVVEIATDQEDEMDQSVLTKTQNLAESQVLTNDTKPIVQTPQKEAKKDIVVDTKEEVIVEAPIPKSNNYSQLNSNQNSDQVKQLIEDNNKLEEERKKIYVEFKKIQIDNTKHIYEKQNLEQQLKDAKVKISLIEKNYSDLKNNLNSNDETKDDTSNDIQEQQLQEITNLKVTNSSLQDQVSQLQKKIQEFSDYDSFKTKLEESSIKLVTLEQEKENLKSTVENQKLELEDLKDRYEIYELEGEVIARDDQIPDDNEKLRENYRLLLKAFESLDIDIEIQKEEYEYRISQLNDKISELNQKRTNIFATKEVKNLIDKKDQEIKELYQLVDQYSQSNKMVERLTEQLQQKDDQFQQIKEQVDISSKRLVYLEEENQLLDEIMNELEENLDLEQQKNQEQIEKREELQTQFDKLKLNIQKYEVKIQQLMDEKQDLTFQTSQLDEDKQQISNMNFQFTKAAQMQSSNLKEKIISDLNSKENYWQSVKYQIYLKSLPQDMSQILQMDMFDKIKNLFLLVTQMDIIQESLCTQFLFDDIIQDENLNLYGCARDVFNQVAEFQYYTNILIERYMETDTKQKLNELEKQRLNQLVFNCQGQIQDIFLLIRNNEFSPQVVFSQLQETNLQLNKEIEQPEEYINQNVHLKILLNQIYKDLINFYINKEEGLNLMDIKKKLVPELIFILREIYLIKFEQSDVLKIITCKEKLKEMLSEFQIWLKNLYKKVDQKFINSNEMQSNMDSGYWLEDIQKLKDELSKFDEMKQNIESQDNDIQKFKELVSSKTQELESFRDQRVKLDNKIMRYYSRIINIRTQKNRIKLIKKNRRINEQTRSKLNFISSSLEFLRNS